MVELIDETGQIFRNGDNVNHEVCGGELGPPQTQSLLPVATEKSSLAHICKLSVDGSLTKKAVTRPPRTKRETRKNVSDCSCRLT